MEHNFYKYGQPPYRILTVHGGPGASRSMQPVAGRISKSKGIIEYVQKKTTIEELKGELLEVVDNQCTSPVVLIGHSWGAWLSIIFAAAYPSKVRKLILVNSGPFEELYAKNIMPKRLERLSNEEMKEFIKLSEKLKNKKVSDKNQVFYQLGNFIHKVDSYLPTDHQTKEKSQYNYHAFREIWPEASLLRQSGELLKMAKKVTCPVIAIHGDYDPHPAKGVSEPLKRVVKDFQFALLVKCGHTPWEELYAKEEFYRIVNDELNGS